MSAAWFYDNWFSLSQTLGILAGLLITAYTMHRDLKARRISDHIAMVEQHRELWRSVMENPDLNRVLDPNRDVGRDSLTSVESQFLISVVVHFHCGWLLEQNGGSLVNPRIRALDAGRFFRLPAPSAVWSSLKAFQEPGFRKFIEESVHSFPGE
jgi:hypothetical protein